MDEVNDQLRDVFNALVEIMRGNLDFRLPVDGNDNPKNTIHIAVNMTIKELARARELQREAEEALQEREQRLRVMFESMQDAVSVIDLEGNVLEANAAHVRMFGYSRKEEVIGRKAFEMVAKKDRARARSCLNKKSNGAQEESAEYTLQDKNGREFFAELSTAVLHDASGRPDRIVSIIRDVTERTRLKEQLCAAQRMEAIGRLAGGVVHDFNNILAVISCFGGFAIDALAEGDPVREDVQQILAAAERATKLTGQLLAFSRRQIVKPVILDLKIVVEDMYKMLRRVVGEDVEICTILELTPGLVKADRGQIEQVVMNLAVNARDAMPAGGRLTIETANIELEPGSSVGMEAEMPPGAYVVLSLVDNGIGMDEEIRRHIFEPFFTTKECGKGTGLGLSTVYGIAKQNGGCVSVESEPGHGTAFRFYLPRVEATDLHTVSRPAGPVSLEGSETVLVVEDDETVRKATQRILRTRGYTVLDAASGNDAILIAKQHEGPIHLLITDVVMPRMGGQVLARHIADVRPNVPVLFVSGYTADAIAHHDVTDGTVLMKPFTERSLLQNVRLLLDAAADGSAACCHEHLPAAAV